MSNDIPCQGCWTLVNDYLDGRLKAGKLESAERHLAACASCRDLLQEVTQLRRLLDRETVPSPSPAFWERCLRAAAASAPARRPWFRRAWKPALALASSAAVVAVVLVRLLPLQERAAPQPPEIAAVGQPRSQYIVRHAEFVATNPLRATSYYLTLSARTGTRSGLGWQAETVELADDGDSRGG